MKKIAITGSGGAGKTTLARQLRSMLNVDIVHMDSIFWKEDWIATTPAERKHLLETHTQQESWIIEGDGDGSSKELIYDLRFAAADTIVWLDFPRHICVWRVLNRLLEYKNTQRSDLPRGCREDLRSDGFHQFLKRIWKYQIEERSLVRERIHQYCGGKRIFILRSVSEVQDFLEVMERVSVLSKPAARAKASKATPALAKLVQSPAVT